MCHPKEKMLVGYIPLALRHSEFDIWLPALRKTAKPIRISLVEYLFIITPFSEQVK
jgi:hypothetical protein